MCKPDPALTEFLQRPPSAAAEDRNVSQPLPTWHQMWAAAAVRGGRGSQRDGWATLRKQALAAAARGGQDRNEWETQGPIVEQMAAAAVRGG